MSQTIKNKLMLFIWFSVGEAGRKKTRTTNQAGLHIPRSPKCPYAGSFKFRPMHVSKEIENAASRMWEAMIVKERSVERTTVEFDICS